MTTEKIKSEYLKGKSNRYSETKYKEIYNFIEKSIPLDISHKEKVYCYINNTSPKCKNPECNNYTRLLNFNEGFRDFCSVSCGSKCNKQSQEISRIKNTNSTLQEYSLEEIVKKLYSKELRIQKWRDIDILKNNKVYNFTKFNSIEQIYKHLILKENMICQFCKKPFNYKKGLVRKCKCKTLEDKLLSSLLKVDNNTFLEKFVKHKLYYSDKNKAHKAYYKRFQKISDNIQEDLYCRINNIEPKENFINFSEGYKKIEIKIDYNKKPEEIIEQFINKYSRKGMYSSLEFKNYMKTQGYNYSNMKENCFLLLGNKKEYCKVCGKPTIFKDNNYKKTCSVKCSNTYYSNLRQEKLKEIFLLKKLPRLLNSYNVELLSKYKSSNQEHKFKCLECSNIFNTTFGNGIFCRKCNPKIVGYSKGEKEIYEYIKKLLPNKTILENARISELNGLELDIYIPDLKIAIEYNGTYWHSSRFKEKNYHLNKTKLCEEQGIHLIHIFDYEYNNKKEIILSIIKAKLGVLSKKIYARKCVIKKISSKESNKFLEENHIQGKDKAPIRYGLYYKNMLVQIITFKRSHRSKEKYMELKRSASLIGYSVIGGFSKLLKYASNEIKEDIITFADRRFSKKENVYTKNNFEYMETIKPNFFYMYNGEFKGRENFQKHKLKNIFKNFNSNLTALENCHNNGLYEIYDVGNYKYKYLHNTN